MRVLKYCYIFWVFSKYWNSSFYKRKNKSGIITNPSWIINYPKVWTETDHVTCFWKNLRFRTKPYLIFTKFCVFHQCRKPRKIIWNFNDKGDTNNKKPLEIATPFILHQAKYQEKLFWSREISWEIILVKEDKNFSLHNKIAKTLNKFSRNFPEY